MKLKLLYLPFFLSLLFTNPAFSQTSVKDLSGVISNGNVIIEQFKSTGASSGNSVEGILQNQTNQEINIEVYLSKPIYLKNRGAGQNMVASQIYNRDGSYLSDGKKSFITLKPRGRSKITFVAYCADFDKDNPNANITVAAQVAVWLAQGERADEINKKFPFTAQDERLARSFLK